MMRWSNFTYVWRTEGWKPAIKIAFRYWVARPWLDLRIWIVKLLIVVLRVEDEV